MELGAGVLRDLLLYLIPDGHLQDLEIEAHHVRDQVRDHVRDHVRDQVCGTPEATSLTFFSLCWATTGAFLGAMVLASGREKTLKHFWSNKTRYNLQ